jgi:mannan endo-1,4-beta-mannosidase
LAFSATLLGACSLEPSTEDVALPERPREAQQALSATGTFYVSGNVLRDYNDNPFLPRGVNMPWAWYKSQSLTALADARAKGANAVRVTLDKDVTTATELQSIIDTAVANKLAVMLYLTDWTGDDSDAAINGSSGAVAWWTSTGSYSSNGIKAVLTNAANKKHILINVANEWKGTWGQGNDWKTTYTTAINTMRAEGLDHTIIVDIGGYGQDISYLKGYGAQLRSALGANGTNMMFSLHLYDVFSDAAKVRQALDACKMTGLSVPSDGNGVADVPCIIGEFGPVHYRAGQCGAYGGQCPVDEDTIMSEAAARRIGYFGWSWTGNTPYELALGLDLLSSWGGAATTWGDRLFTGADGFTASSQPSSLHQVKLVNKDNLELALAGDMDKSGNIVAEAAASADDHLWSMVADGTGWYYLQNKKSLQYANVAGAFTFDNANISQWDTLAGDHLKIRLVDAGGGYYKVQFKHSLKYMTTAGNSNGTNVQQGADSATDTKLRWQRVVSGSYFKFVQHTSGLELGVAADTQNSANVTAEATSGAADHQWTLEDDGAGYYFLKSGLSGLWANVTGAYANHGANVAMWNVRTAGDHVKVKFIYDAAAAAYRVQFKHSNKYLCTFGPSSGTNVQQCDLATDNKQLWTVQ